MSTNFCLLILVSNVEMYEYLYRYEDEDGEFKLYNPGLTYADFLFVSVSKVSLFSSISTNFYPLLLISFASISKVLLNCLIPQNYISFCILKFSL